MQHENFIAQLFALILILAGSLAFCIGFFFWKFGKGQYKHFHEKERILKQQQQQQIEEGERVMLQISREVHDNIGQNAVLSRILLGEAIKMVTDENSKKALSSVADIIIKIINEASDISRSLNKDFILAQGLENMIAKTLSYLETTNKLKASFETEGNPANLPPEIELVAFRIAQEAINNIVKHANATEIKVELSYMDKRLLLSIADNGFGIDSDKPKGIGLTNMDERAKYINGKLTISSLKDYGTTVQLLVQNITLQPSD